MNKINYIKGNIFSSSCQTLVNTINCVGVMGAGLALEFKYRYPEMYDKYKLLCEGNKIQIGKLWIYRIPNSNNIILNFPTKKHWKDPSEYQFIEKGLQRFCETYEEKGITSIAFPLLGTQNGQLESKKVIEIMEQYLKKCNIEVEIYEFDKNAEDDLFIKFKKTILNTSPRRLEDIYGLKTIYYKKLIIPLKSPQFCSLLQLSKVKGIGDEIIKICYNISMDRKLIQNNNLFSDDASQTEGELKLSREVLKKIEKFNSDVKIRDLLVYCTYYKLNIAEFINKFR